MTVETAAFPRWLAFTTRSRLRAAVRHYQPDIIQGWMGRAAASIGRLPGRKVGWFGGYYDLKRFRTCDHFVGVTHDIARHIAAAGVPAERVHVIHTFSEIDDLPPVPRRDFGTPEEAPLVLALARLHPKKGLDTLLHALTRLPGHHLWIAGEGPSRGGLERLARELGLTGRVRFLGWRTDRGALLRSADVCAFPSRYEPFGTVMVEAWSTGTPIVAAASDGPRAYIRHEENGLLCAIDDADGLARAIARCTAEPGLREAIIGGGRASYEETFTRERIVEAWHRLYAAIASS